MTTKYRLYDGDVELEFGEKVGHKGRKRQGYWIDGKQVLRVTKAGADRVPFIVAAKWGAKMAAEVARQNIMDEMNQREIDELVEMMRKAPDDTTARDRGTRGHKFIEGYLRHKFWGGPFPGGPEAYPSLEKELKLAVEWIDNHVVELYDVEFRCLSREWNYAGTGDMDAEIDSGLGCERQIVDWKFGAIRPSVRTQTAAYQAARTEELGIEYDARRVISLTDKGLKTEVYYDIKKDFDAFLNLLQYTQWTDSL